MNESVKKKAAGVQPGRGFSREASLKDKRTHLDLIEVHISQLAEELNHGNQKALQQVLDFFGAGRKCARWSYWNLLGLLRQRPDLQRPVTIREAAEVGHYLKRGVKPAAIFVPRVVELCADKGPSPENSLRKEALPWKANEALRLQLFPSGLLLQVWQEPSAPGEAAWLKAAYPSLVPLELGSAKSLVEAQDKALASLTEEQLHELVKASAGQNAPKPQTRTYFNLVHCVVDLGRDTAGPALMAEADETGEDTSHVLEAITEYARSVGVEPITHRRTVDELASGSIGTTWADGKIFVSDALSPERQIGIWLHELTHWLTHLRPEAARLTGSGVSTEGEPQPTHIRELQAEACAYVVGRALGIRSDFSIGYLAGWHITKRDVELNLRVIAHTSRQLLQGISPFIRKEAQQLEETLAATQEPSTTEEAIPESWEEFQKAFQSQEEPFPGQKQHDETPIKTRIRITL
jgi:hypothetical protein